MFIESSKLRVGHRNLSKENILNADELIDIKLGDKAAIKNKL
jgi:hypothetical protein